MVGEEADEKVAEEGAPDEKSRVSRGVERDWVVGSSYTFRTARRAMLVLVLNPCITTKVG